jgi:HD-GYP domain
VEKIQRHPEIGYRILSSSSEFSELARYVLEHQERWDGKGYPKRLAGEEISVQARIIGVADAFDAMTCDRAYRKGLSVEEAVAEIRKCAGTQFDPQVASVFIEKVLTQS